MTHLDPRRLLAGTAGALLLAASLSACGGGPGSGAPEDASQEDFCAVLQDSPEGDSVSADQIHDYADKLGDVGTPKDIDGDAREGFEIFVDYIADISDDDIEKFDSAEDPSEIFEGDDGDKVTAFFTQAFSQCIPDIEDLPTDAPS